MVPREPSLIGLVASEEVDFAEASSTCVIDDGGEQHGRDHQVVVPEFVDDHLIGRAATSESGREAIEDGKEAGAASPLGPVELAQGIEALQDCQAPDRLMPPAFGRETLGGDTEVLPELRGQGGPVRLW